ncbi:MAG: hypothetical protein COB67_11375 [SAR324 cluster bacterium]|uniref:Uncharacterized protein n=1 Tax=SAR324 cluster bacterium TaxID=2024889 RepID=A0A2A4SUH4_9DELT|nr:MAG: hypothetical protein COB67_11375 [SAR324 cluster bacterium]
MNSSTVVKNVCNVAVVGRDTVGKSKVIEGLLKLQPGTDSTIIESSEEESRGYTIYNRFYRYESPEARITLIDTPGNTNFLPKVKTALYIAGTALFVVSGTGISDSSMRVWESVVSQDSPRAIFINMLDLPEANFENTLHDIELKLSLKPLVLFIPWSDDGKLVGVIDVLKEQLILGQGRKPKIQELPLTSQEEVTFYRESTVEQLAELDEELMELYIEGKPLPVPLLEQVLTQSVLQRKVTPILVGAAKAEVGTLALKLFMEQHFPAYHKHSSWVGVIPEAGSTEYVERKPIASEPFSAISFKTIHDRYAGKLSYLLVLSGSLGKGAKILNSSTHEKFVVGRINYIHGEKLKEMEMAGPGDIILLEKMEEISSNQTFCDPAHPVLFDPMPRLIPHCTFRLVIPEKVKEERVLTALQRCIAEDPSYRLHKNNETGEMLLSGMGVMHLQVLQEYLEKNYDVEISLELPEIAYHETISATVNVEGKHKKQTGGHGQFGVVKITIEPLPRGGGFEFINKIVGGSIPRQFISSVEKGVIEALQKGHLGFPVVDVKVTLNDGAFHNVDSSDYSFQAAGIQAIRKALPEAKPTLLEPIMEVEIDVPEHAMGRISKDIASRRGRIQGYEPREFTNVVTAAIPLSELQNYTPVLREMTHGLGMYDMNLKQYEVLSSHLASKVLAKRNKNAS